MWHRQDCRSCIDAIIHEVEINLTFYGLIKQDQIFRKLQQGIIMRIFLVSFILAIFSIGALSAGEAEDIAKIQERIDKLAPQEKPGIIKPTKIDGLYEVMYGAEVFYFSADGRYVLQGSMVDLDTNENLTETARVSIRSDLLSKLNKSEMILFSPKNPRYSITVFTDIDCGYCRKLHSEMDQLNSYGIEVRYMMFPRSGVDTPSYQKAVNVWCSKDQQASMTKAKAGEDIPEAKCDNPVEAQLLMGQKLGVNGTPALFMDDGTFVPGYRPAKELAAMLDSTPNEN